MSQQAYNLYILHLHQLYRQMFWLHYLKTLTQTQQYYQINLADSQNLCGECSFINQIYYDQYSRSKIEQDVSGKAILNSYNTQGYLQQVSNADDPSQSYYRINQTDKFGNITSDTKASNLIIGVLTGGLGWNIFWVGFASGFTSAIIITGNLKSALKAGLIAGALAFAGDALFGNGIEGANEAVKDVTTKGRAKTAVKDTALEKANQITNDTTSATGSSLSNACTNTGEVCHLILVME